MIRRLKRINEVTEAAFKRFSLGLKKAEIATLQQNRKIVSHVSTDRCDGLEMSFNQEHQLLKVIRDTHNNKD